MCRDLPFTFIFIAHQYIIAEYYELPLTLPVIVDIHENSNEAGNKLSARRQCFNATMTILLAFVTAHFLVKSFYTLEPASTKADLLAEIFSTVMQLVLAILSVYSFVAMHNLGKREPFLAKERYLWVLHIVLGITLSVV